MSQYHDGDYEEDDDDTNHSHLMDGGRSNTYSISHSYDVYNYSNVFFATEKINLPRDRVVDVQSVNSSPSHGFRREISPCKKDNHSESGDGNPVKFSMRPGSLSPRKVGQNYLAHINGTTEPPGYDPNTDYYKEFWRLYL